MTGRTHRRRRCPAVRRRLLPVADLPLPTDPVRGPGALLRGVDPRRASVAGAAGLVATVGVVNGIAINTAHELGHKRERVERWLSKVALAPTGYGHFYVEHNRGHHVRVATRDDPASSRLGRATGRSGRVPSSVACARRGGWRPAGSASVAGPLDPPQRRAQRLGPDPAAVRGADPGLRPRRAAVPGAPGRGRLLPVGVGQLPGALRAGPAAHHRRPLREGRPRHSWNSDRTVTNVFLFQLQRHSDHHANPLRRYQTLRSFDTSPQLPAGYATMVVVALVPPLWRRVMDRRVLAHYGGDRARANVHRRT
ncbi:fatty acid desaturase [Micromonospora sp. M12]